MKTLLITTLFVTMTSSSLYASVNEKKLVACKETQATFVFIETEIWLHDNKLWFLKFINHDGGEKALMAMFPVRERKVNGTVFYEGEKSSVVISQGKSLAVLKENIMEKDYSTKIECSML